MNDFSIQDDFFWGGEAVTVLDIMCHCNRRHCNRGGLYYIFRKVKGVHSSYKFCSGRNDNKKINVLVGTCNLSACPCPSLTTEATACGRPRWTHTARRSYSHARTESLKKACISRYGGTQTGRGKRPRETYLKDVCTGGGERGGSPKADKRKGGYMDLILTGGRGKKGQKFS